MVVPRHPNDSVTIAPDVLLTIARMATTGVAGVVAAIPQRKPFAGCIQANDKIMVHEDTVTRTACRGRRHANLREMSGDPETFVRSIWRDLG
jgi:hypothetical protein